MTEHTEGTRYEPSPADRARWAMDKAILDVVRAEHGDDAIAERVPHGLSSGFPDAADQRHGITAALMLARYARGCARRFAEHARADGHSWESLAEPLGYDPDEDGDDPAGWAFREVAGHPSQPYDTLTVGWRCSSCQGWVTDRGPYNGHPDDDESGHVEGCGRHAHDIAEWKVRTGWEDDDE